MQDKDHGCAANSLGMLLGWDCATRVGVEGYYKLNGHSDCVDYQAAAFTADSGPLHGVRLTVHKNLGSTDTAKVAGLLDLRCGKYIISFLGGTHCIALDADAGVVHDPDPDIKYTLPATPAAAALLGITDIVKVYKVESSVSG